MRVYRVFLQGRAEGLPIHPNRQEAGLQCAGNQRVYSVFLQGGEEGLPVHHDRQEAGLQCAGKSMKGLQCILTGRS